MNLLENKKSRLDMLFCKINKEGYRPFLIESYSIARPSGLPVSHSY